MNKIFMTGAALFMGLHSFAQENTGTVVEQEGAGNVLEVSGRLDSESYLSVMQGGGLNKAILNLNIISSNILIHQAGLENSLEMESFDDYTQTEIKQIGSDNYLVLQSGVSSNSEIFISQGVSTEAPGRGNRANVQTYGMENQFLDLKQIGEENDATVQQSVASAVTIAQFGALNISDVYQQGIYFNVNHVQSGESNSGVITQHSEGAILELLQIGSHNVAQVHQEGILAEAELQQSGNSNQMEVEQSGFYGNMSVVQGGEGNLIEIHQEGMFPELDFKQEGDYNKAIILQGNSYYDHYNFLTGSQIGNSNEISISQAGDENRAAVHQLGNHLKASIIQQ